MEGMVLIDQAQVGPYQLRLIERPSALGAEFFAPRFYFACTHAEGPWLTAIAFLGQDRGHATRQFERRRDNQMAALEMERVYG
jgi:hypothetical protein